MTYIHTHMQCKIKKAVPGVGYRYSFVVDEKNIVLLTKCNSRIIVLVETNAKERMNIALQKYVKKPYKK